MIFLILRFTFLFLFISSISQAGGPLSVNELGLPAMWDNDSDIPIHPEAGSCADFNNGAMLTKLADNLSLWEDIGNIDLSFSIEAGDIAVDVDASNYAPYFENAPVFNVVIFDDDGQIMVDYFGQGSDETTLGIAGSFPSETDDNVVVAGFAVFNCYCIENEDCDAPGQVEELDKTIVHEFGHFIGLDHSQVNQALVEAPCDTDSVGDCAAVPIMYPREYDAGEITALSRDDQVSALSLYGDSDWDDGLCTVTGVVLDAEGSPLRCADIQAVTNDVADTISFVSGALALASDNNSDGDTTDSGECESDCGSFVLRGLAPTLTYTIRVVPIDESWISGSSVGPCSGGQPTGVVLETIGTSADCTAGGTVDLGSITTTSTSDAVDSGEETEVDSGDSGVACGEGQDFSGCDDLISCSLQKNASNDSAKWGFLFFMTGLMMVRHSHHVRSAKKY